MLLTIHFLYPVVDVSAQTTRAPDGHGGECTVTVLRPNTLTNDGGALLNPSTNVRFNCSCDASDGSARFTQWYGTDVIRLGTSTTNNVYQIAQNRDSVLVIQTFTESNAGTYVCGGNYPDNPPNPRGNITLTICKLIINTINYFT